MRAAINELFDYGRPASISLVVLADRGGRQLPICAQFCGTRVDVPEATVSDAVMMLDLRNTNALLFKNAGTGKHNMVYRRGDGSIGWVEPS